MHSFFQVILRCLLAQYNATPAHLAHFLNMTETMFDTLLATPPEFARKYEFKIHAVVWLFPINGTIMEWAKCNLNPTRLRSLCFVADYPFLCSIDPDTFGQCTRDRTSNRDSNALILVNVALTLI